MPNWCSTSINIYCKDEKQAKDFYDKIEKWTSENYQENGFGTNWLGNIVLGSGIGTVSENPDTDVKCRGYITYKDLHREDISLATETAWTPMLRMWRILIDKYAPGAELVYTAEEPGGEIFCTNDSGYIGYYYLDDWDSCDTFYDAKEDFVVEYLQKKLGTNETDVSKLIKQADYEDLLISVHQWEYLSPDEWD